MTQTMSRPASPLQGLSPQPQYEITDADKARIKQIEDAWKAYDGNLQKPLSTMQGQPDDNVMSNRCRPVVDRGVDFLFGLEVDISVEDSAPDEAQDALDDIWGEKEKRIPLLQKWAMNGAVAGTAFLRIVPEPNNVFRIITVDPSTVYVKTAPQDCETVLLYCIEYSTSEKINGRDASVFYREEIVRIDPDDDGDDGDPFADADANWQIQHWTRIGDKGNWTAAGEPIIWPYPFPPIFANQNLPKPNDFWGYSDLPSDLVGLNDSLNFVQSNVNRIQKIYGAPIVYATGTDESSISIATGKIIGLPTVDGKIQSVTIASDVANALAFAANLRSDIDEQSGVPGVATGRIVDLPKGNLPGITIELLFMPLIKKTGKKQCLYGATLINVSKALLVLMKMSGDIGVTIAWGNPLPHDDLPAIQAAISKKELGISNTTLMRELQYDPDEEMALSQSEDQQKLLAYSQGIGMPPPQIGLPPGVLGVPNLPGQTYPPPAPSAGQAQPAQQQGGQ